MEVVLKRAEKTTVDDMLELFKTLTEDEKQALNYMIQGMRLANRLQEKKSA